MDIREKLQMRQSGDIHLSTDGEETGVQELEGRQKQAGGIWLGMEDEAMDIREKLQMNIYTDTEKTVCQWMVLNLEKAAEFSLRQMAEAAFTSAPTVLRVIQKAGYPGLSSFHKDVLVQLEQEKRRKVDVNFSAPFSAITQGPVLRVIQKAGYPGLSSFHKDVLVQLEQEKRRKVDVNFSAPFSAITQGPQLVGAMKSLFEETVARTAAMLKTADLAHVARSMSKAERIFIYAYGDSAICAQTLINRLAKINIYPILITGHSQELQESWNVTRNDFALFLSYSGASSALARCAAILRSSQVPGALITANPHSLLAQAHWDVITVPAEEKEHVIAGFQSQLSLDFVLSLLYSMIFQADFKRLSQRKKVIDEAKAK